VGGRLKTKHNWFTLSQSKITNRETIFSRRLLWYTFKEYWFSFSLGAFAKLPKATISFVMSVRMKRLSFYWTEFVKFAYFSKICRENSGYLKIRQELGVLYMKTYSRL
jgi:hypothetical protein